MLAIIIIFLIAVAIYLPSKKKVSRQVNLGKRHLDNLDKIDPYARKVIEKWVYELNEEVEGLLEDKDSLNRLIGLKIAQSRSTGELGKNFKELPKSVDLKE